MKNLNKKNFLISLALIFSISTSPVLLLPKKTQAQSIDVSGNTLGNIASVMPLCGEGLVNGIGDIFNGIGNLFSSDDTSNASFNNNGVIDGGGDNRGAYLDNENLEQVSSGYESALTSVPVIDEVVRLRLTAIENSTRKTEELTNKLNNNDSCLDGIAKMLMKIALQKITESTVEYINGGFKSPEGKTLWVTQPGKFFLNVAKEEFLDLGVTINNPDMFPFSREWLRRQANHLNRKFEDNARYSLNELVRQTNPTFTDAEFTADFSKGGWEAFLYMTQVPANNPLGFNILASNELSKRLSGTESSKAQELKDSLQQSGGFLGDERCVDAQGKPTGITKSDHLAALRRNEKSPCDPTKGQRWQYVTPGKLIAEAAIGASQWPEKVYLNADDLNSAIGAILDALVAQFTNKLITDGFANVNSANILGSSYIYNNQNSINYTQTQLDYLPSQLASSWLKNNPNFNIRKHLNQALIDEQRTFIEKLMEQNRELFSTTDGRNYTITNGVSNAYGLIPTIYQLDYCIPGPHPGWENDSRNTINNVIRAIPPAVIDNMDTAAINSLVASTSGLMANAITVSLLTTGATAAATATGAAATGAALGSAVPLIGTAVGAIVGYLVGELLKDGKDAPNKTYMFFGAHAGGYLGVSPNIKNGSENPVYISSAGALHQGLDLILSRYADIIKKTYDNRASWNDDFWDLKTEADSKYNKLRGYGEMFRRNSEKIAQMRGTVNQLNELKRGVDGLNTKLASGEIDTEKYEYELESIRRAFGRLTSYLVNGDDIAKIDNLTKQIQDERTYIYEQMIKGRFGCEQLFAKTQPRFPSPWNSFDIRSTARVTYPQEILYDYNYFTKGDILPDPLQNKRKNGVVIQNIYPDISVGNSTKLYCTDGETCDGNVGRTMIYGPGFLSFIFFSLKTNRGEEKNAPEYTDNPARLKIHDVFDVNSDIAGDRYRAVGQRYKNTKEDLASGGNFERTIGIY